MGHCLVFQYSHHGVVVGQGLWTLGILEKKVFIITESLLRLFRNFISSSKWR